MFRRVLKLGASPEKPPPFPKKAKTTPTKIEMTPRSIKIPRQEHNPKRTSTNKGATTPPRLGANSWMATAFPQCSELTNPMRVAIPEGR